MSIEKVVRSDISGEFVEAPDAVKIRVHDGDIVQEIDASREEAAELFADKGVKKTRPGRKPAA